MNSAMSFQPAFNPGTQANIPGLLTAISQRERKPLDEEPHRDRGLGHH